MATLQHLQKVVVPGARRPERCVAPMLTRRAALSNPLAVPQLGGGLGVRTHAPAPPCKALSTETMQFPDGARDSGKSAPAPETVPLPALDKAFWDSALPGGLAKIPAAAFGADRPCNALIYAPVGVPEGATVPAVIFSHGFSQPATNYESTLRALTEQGWLVIAPTTNIIDILRYKIETTGFFTKAPAKMQTAILLDGLRSAQYVKQGLSKYKISDVLLCGHSMGAATSIVNASHLKGMAKGVGVMAPAVKATLVTQVNQLLHMDGSPQSTKDALEFFAQDFPPTAPLTILGGRDDFIVRPKEVENLYAAAAAGDTGDLSLYWLDGSHIGFEDKVNVEVNIFPINILLNIVNILLYQLELTRFITGDFSKQREVTHKLLVSSFQAALVASQDNTVPEVEKKFNVSVAKRGADWVVEAKEALARTALEAPANAPWVVPTLALLSYAAVEGGVAAQGVGLLQSSGSTLSTLSWVGLAALTGLSAGLVYENTILAAGRLITDKGTKNLDLLDALNDPRFLLHSAVPLLGITGVDMAQRAGVEWASNGVFEGGVTAVALLLVTLSTIRNALLLQTRPQWSWGVLHYTYDDINFDFTRIVPVAVTTVLLTVLGSAAALKDPSYAPFAAGSVACLALAGGLIPRKVVPSILTGNGGEAILMASLLATEIALLSK